ncbi:hypothetical protein NPX13_g714 [Xylaria arbuscula]|uniref:Ketosynthase family 3 (KS3) domain-containing protein n=1 Tax=Xylaria arbuscula TaxID=114810 RepID=A0A9W8NNZ8_9PEZI|nr:hypothetical protein NPX13_g714 [Xylaria arbuscula]
MPSATAQADLIRPTYKRCGLALDRADDRPQYFEAHGTAPPAGDHIEVEAIQAAFFPDASYPSNRNLFVGSIKTIIGHLGGSAGLVGMLKISLAMQNGTIPPNKHLNELNPRTRPFYNNLQILTRAITWLSLRKGVLKRASVNSFGFGGTNARAIIESYELDIGSFSGNNEEQLIEKLDRTVTGASVATKATTVTARLHPHILGVFTGQGANSMASYGCTAIYLL